MIIIKAQTIRTVYQTICLLRDTDQSEQTLPVIRQGI